ncbi:hypothetical protein BGZ54_004033 [Gamsiella multidivaricata]|nr:hypothetical protein BGZ54_004033 [Gamsiella multidivaricata]
MVGLVEVFYGFKFIRLTLFVAGFLSWAVAAMIIMVAFRWDLVYTTFMPQHYYMWVWLVAGLTGAILSFRFWDLGVTFTGAFGGFAVAMGVIAVANLSIGNAGRYVILGLFILGGAAIATFFERVFIICGTSCGGAFIFMFGVDQFAQVGYREMIVIFDFTGKTLNYHPSLQVYLMLGFSLVLAGLGIAWEFWHHATPLLMDRKAIFRIYGRPFGKRPRRLVGQRIHHHLKTRSGIYTYITGCHCLERWGTDDVLYGDDWSASEVGHPVPSQSPIAEEPSPMEEIGQGHSGQKESKTMPMESSSDVPLKSAPVEDGGRKHAGSTDHPLPEAAKSETDKHVSQHSGSTRFTRHAEGQTSGTTHIITPTTTRIERTEHSEHSETGLPSHSTIPQAEIHHPLFSPQLGARTVELLRLVIEEITPGSTISREFLAEHPHARPAVSPSIWQTSSPASEIGSTSELLGTHGLYTLEVSDSASEFRESQESDGPEEEHEAAGPHYASASNK